MNIIQAAEINRTFTQETGGARGPGFEQPMAAIARQAGPGQFQRGAAEGHHDGRAQGGGHVQEQSWLGRYAASKVQGQ